MPVTIEGKNKLLNVMFKGDTAVTTWYGGLVSASPTLAEGDTMASHAGWTEPTGYSEAVRQTVTLGAVANKSVDNSASKMVFTASGALAAGGAFITDSNVKGGTTGLLYGTYTFTTGDKNLTAAQTLTVDVTLSLA